MAVFPPPDVASRRSWREQFEAALAAIDYGQIVLKIEAHQVVRVDVLQQYPYTKKSLDESLVRA